MAYSFYRDLPFFNFGDKKSLKTLDIHRLSRIHHRIKNRLKIPAMLEASKGIASLYRHQQGPEQQARGNIPVGSLQANATEQHKPDKGANTKKPFKRILRGVKSAILTGMKKHLTLQKQGLKPIDIYSFFRV